MKKRPLNLDLLFVLMTCMVIVPRLFLERYEGELSASVSVPLFDRWTVKDSSGAVLFSDLQLPADLRQFPKNHENRHWTFERKVPVGSFQNFKKPGLAMGRMGDSDEVAVNGCRVGSTGLNRDRTQRGWWWSVLRIYEVPNECLVALQGADQATLTVDVYKWGGPSFGIYGGPIGIGESDRLERYSQIIDLFRSGTLLLFGLIMFLNGSYYLFVYILIPSRKYYLVFAMTMFSIGVFEMMTSTLPFRYSTDGEVMMKILFSSAVFTANLFYLFLHGRFGVLGKNFLMVSVVFGGLAWVLGMFQSDLLRVYAIYEAWHGFFLVSLTYVLVSMTKQFFRGSIPDFWRYYYGFVAFFLSCLHDVYTTYTGSASPYLITYGFMFLAGAVALSLAKESADAFLHVEAQVEDRTRDLATALEQLRSLDKMKERFFANISHDFKTPIAVALGTLEEMKSKLSSLTKRDFMPAERSLSQLLQMVGDILDIVKAESGTLKIDWKKARPAELLREWSESYRVLCDKKGLRLHLEVDGFEGLVVPMDVAKMHRAVENVVSNAIKFTDADPKRANVIELRLRCDDARMYIDVSDSGIGIPKEDRAKVFDRYYQSSNVTLKNYGGSGIGLSFVKEVLESMNGEIRLDESEFGGSKFTLSMPLSQDVEITGEYMQSNAKEVQQSLRGSLDVAYPAERPKTEETGRPRVFFAEDNPEVAHIIYQALSDDYNLHFASNGYRALERLKAERFDCVLTDIVMPILRGDELVPKIRVEAADRDVPIIVLSSQGDEDTITEMLKNGANDFVSKPFRREILKARVHAQIMAHRTSKWIAQNEKVIELGFLAGGMAHQIRNGLHSLKNQVHYQEKLAENLLADATTLPPEQQEKLRKNLDRSKEAAKRALDRIEHLTDSVRTYSTGSQQATEIKIQDSVSLALSLMEEKIKKNAVLVEVSVGGLSILAYTSFHEVLVNLVANALDACPKDGTGKIAIHGRDLGDSVELSIRDNGVGIEPTALGKLFAPFYTTKPPEQGTGLGLYIARDVIEGQHHGSLTAISEGAGRGATFIVRVPKIAPKAVTDAEVLVHNVSVS